MPTEVVLGIDAGTTSAKSVIADADGRILTTAASDPIDTLTPEPGAAEQDPARVFDALGEACRRSLSEVGPVSVRAVAIAAQSGSVMPLDSTGAPVARFATWMDSRAAGTVEELSARERQAIRSISGWTPTPGLGLSTITWSRDDRPEIFAAAARWVQVDDFLVSALTGTWATNPSNASGMQLMDVGRLAWDERLCAIAGIRPAQLSTIEPTGTITGHIINEAIDLATGAELVVGGHDQACAALGLGATEAGAVFVSAGTAWVLTAVTATVDVSELPDTLNLSPHVIPSRWSASRNLGGIGATIDWWRHAAHGPHPAPELLETDLRQASGSGPWFVSSLSDPERTGWGRFADRTGSEISGPDRADCTYAVLEAAAFEVRSALGAMGSVSPPTALTVVGGAARSTGLCQLVADATRLPVARPADASWPAIGAASIAAHSRSWADPAPLARLTARRNEPDPARAERLDQRFETYRQLAEGAQT